MSPRLLVIVLPGQQHDVFTGLPTLIAVARAEHAAVRLACFQPIPPPRIGHHGRVVFDTDGAMAHVAGTLADTLMAATRRFDDVASDVVVRFGTPRVEIALELEAYTPAFVACFAPRSAGPFARLSAWALRRRIARVSDARLVVLDTSGARPAWPHGISTGWGARATGRALTRRV